MSNIFPNQIASTTFGPGVAGSETGTISIGTGGVTQPLTFTSTGLYTPPSYPKVSLQKGETATFRRIGDLYLEIFDSYETRKAYLWVGSSRTALSAEDATALQLVLTETL